MQKLDSLLVERVSIAIVFDNNGIKHIMIRKFKCECIIVILFDDVYSSKSSTSLSIVENTNNNIKSKPAHK